MEEEKLQQIAEALAGLTYKEWCKVRHAIEQKYSLAMGKVRVAEAEEFMGLLRLEVLGKFK